MCRVSRPRCRRISGRTWNPASWPARTACSNCWPPPTCGATFYSSAGSPCASQPRPRHPAAARVGCHSYAHRLIYEKTPPEFRATCAEPASTLQDPSANRDRLPRLRVYQRRARRGRWTSSSKRVSPSTPASTRRTTTATACRRRCTRTATARPAACGSSRRRCDVTGYPVPVGGGGYFRLYPYALTRWACGAINPAGRPFAAYLHPWEIDPDQPRASRRASAGASAITSTSAAPHRG